MVHRVTAIRVHDEVKDQTAQHLVRQRFAILLFHVHEELQEIFLGLMIAMLAPALDNVPCKIIDHLLVLGHLLVHSRAPFTESPIAHEESVEHDSVQSVKGCRKLYFFLGTLQTSKGLTE